MGFLDQLWDDTVAGPRPDSGLGKLRKYVSLSPSSTSSSASSAAAAAASTAAEAAGGVPAVTRSVTVLRPPALSVTSPRSESSSAPCSPASVSAGPDSPFSAATTPTESGWKKLRRKGRTALADGAEAPGTPRSPTVYDWVVISSMDR